MPTHSVIARNIPHSVIARSVATWQSRCNSGRPNRTKTTPPNPPTCPTKPLIMAPKPFSRPPFSPYRRPNALLKLAEMRGNEREIDLSAPSPRDDKAGTRESPGRRNHRVQRDGTQAARNSRNRRCRSHRAGSVSLARFGTCADCGRRVRGNYTRCYRCNARRRRSNWHDPERLENLEERDAELGRSEFYVYVSGYRLWSLCGTYGECAGQAGRSCRQSGGIHRRRREPELLWTSYPFRTRREAARFEAALKSLRDQRSERFQEITGLEPEPFEPLYPEVPTRHSGRSGGCGLFALTLSIMAMAILVLGLALS